ncbi:MAG TPA: S9 family peptidase, partial [Phenylobacterium sp.]|nr:S9 family peptidase [Phenylobacterium sp.]
MRIVVSVLAGVVMGMTMVGQASAEKLTAERVYAAPDLSGPRARGVSLSPDGTLVTYLKAKADDPRMTDLWAADVTGGDPRLLIDARALIPK